MHVVQFIQNVASRFQYKSYDNSQMESVLFETVKPTYST